MKIVDFRDRLLAKGKFRDLQDEKNCEKAVYKMWISSLFIFHILVHIEIVENFVEKRGSGKPGDGTAGRFEKGSILL